MNDIVARMDIHQSGVSRHLRILELFADGDTVRYVAEDAHPPSLASHA